MKRNQRSPAQEALEEIFLMVVEAIFSFIQIDQETIFGGTSVIVPNMLGK